MPHDATSEAGKTGCDAETVSLWLCSDPWQFKPVVLVVAWSSRHDEPRLLEMLVAHSTAPELERSPGILRWRDGLEQGHLADFLRKQCKELAQLRPTQAAALARVLS